MLKLGKVNNKINLYTVAIMLMCIYVFFSYNAVNIVFPRVLNSLALYAFLAFAAFLYILSLKNKEALTVNIYTVWYFAVMSISMLSMLYSPVQDLLSGAFYLMIVSFVLTFFIIFLVRSEKTFEVICWVFFASAIVLVFLLMISGNMSIEDTERLGQELMGNANIFSSMMSISAMYGLWLITFKGRGILQKLFVLVGIVLIFYALALSGGRRGFVIPIVFLFVIMMVKAISQNSIKLIKYFCIFILILLIVFYAVMNIEVLYNSIGVRFEGLISGITGVGTQDNSSLIRDELRIIAINGWLDAPIFGHGFDSFKYLALSEVGEFFYSHCNYTELLYNNGLFGLIIYYSIFFIILKRAFERKHVDIKYRAFAIGTVLSFFVSDYGGICYNTFITQQMLALSLIALNFVPKKTVE